ncbi:MAG: formate dehydrogenase accessory sulfurtransferase FdhD [Dehalococcoidia bacterium]|nr:formate dehydrogenase accessory sulfurtransferase FdhD [Dehalococcoidia bacterium]
MDKETEEFSVLRLSERGNTYVEDVVAREWPLTIVLNNRELATLLCSPTNLTYLAIGFLLSEGLLKSKDDIKRITVDEQRGVARVETGEDEDSEGEVLFRRFITSGCGRGVSFYNVTDVQDQAKVESSLEVSKPEILTLVREFQHRSQTYRTTGGVHSAALCDTSEVLVFSEDIGRHNAIDKIVGECVLNGIATADRILLTSGRISSEILLKVARRNIPMIVSKSAPTSLGLKLAVDLGVTLVGFVRGRRMNVYTHDWRVSRDGH